MGDNLDHNPFFHLLTNSALRYRLIRHGLLWSTALWAIYAGFKYIGRTIPDPLAQQNYAVLSTLIFGGLTITGYWIITRLTRQFILRRFRIGLFLVSVLAVHVATSMLVWWHFGWFTRHLGLANSPQLYRTYDAHVAQLSFWQVPFDNIIVTLFSFSLFYNYVVYAVGLKVFKDLFTMKLRQTQLETDNVQLEFNFLKAQINPHFLFNTLNNIYSFSIKSPDKVPDAVLKLADLMRYALYETEPEFVPLEKEISFLESYVQLQRIRHEADADLTFVVTGRPDNWLIPPLLLMVFVENAFKHGFQASTQAGWIHISLVIEPKRLTFSVKNSIPAASSGMPGGIGLSNVRRRLILFYENRHQLTAGAQVDEFQVHLVINPHGTTLPSRYR